MQANLKYINRNALACLLGQAGSNIKTKEALVLDLRRHDERTLYGTIPGPVKALKALIPIMDPCKSPKGLCEVSAEAHDQEDIDQCLRASMM